MNLRITYTLFSLIIFSIILLSNSGGRAGSTNWGNTGAPGDETLSNGNVRTCQNCHAAGDIQVTMDLEILDGLNNPITSYTPNETYTAKITITSAAGPMPAGYGFQLVSLYDLDNSDVKGWKESGHSDNVQIEASTNTNRVYAEHKGVSSSNEFLVQWQAPLAGSGDLSFYAAGNGVNGNGSNSGDGAAIPQKFTLTENLVSDIKELSNLGINFTYFPNPVKNQFSLNFNTIIKREIIIKIINSMGKVVYDSRKDIRKGKSKDIIDLSEFAKGIYWLQLSSDNAISTQKIIKL